MLEGLDGAGTTTQTRMLSERLTRERSAHWATWEPTDGPVGRLIRSILVREVSALPCTIALLYAADRAEHTGSPDGILARARRGELVISDRYLFSSIAYQGIQCDEQYVYGLNSPFPLPQVLFFIDTPVDVCQGRLSRRGKEELFDGAAFQSRVRERYLASFQRFQQSGMRIVVADGDRPAAQIHEELWGILAACR